MKSLQTIARTIGIAALLLGVSAMGDLPGLPGADAAFAQAKPKAQADERLHRGTDDALGHRVYMAYCATCHGRTGGGDGPDAKGFAQPPTIFTKGTYAFRSTVGDVPAPGDLERSIRVGMSGTEMVPFAGVLSERSIAAVAAYIRSLSPELADPDAQVDADDVVKIPEKRPFPRTAQTIEQGAKIWEDQGCADCHGDDGRGTNEEKDDWDRPVFMVPFQYGALKSGPTDADIYRSIAAGMKGTTMDAYRDEAKPDEIWKMVDFIRSLDERGDRGLIGFFTRVKPSGFDYTDY